MRRIVLIASLLFGSSVALLGTDTQGVVVDWNCIQSMVKNGRANTLRDNHNCSLRHNYQRPAYGLITDDNKAYRLDDKNNEHILPLLQGNPDKDNLKVVVTGDITDDTIKVVNITML